MTLRLASISAALLLAFTLVGCGPGGTDAPPGVAPVSAKPIDPNETTNGQPVAARKGLKAGGPGGAVSGPASGTPGAAK